MSKKIFGTLALIALSINNVGAAELSSAQTLASQWVITTSGDYRLNDSITRKEMMKIVMNLSGDNVPDICSGMFPDVSNDWGCKYIEEALNQGFIAANATFRPDDTITKAESMKLVLKARGIGKVQNSPDWQKDYMQTALQNGLITSSYNDHNTQATRWWIFNVGATPVSANSNTAQNTTVAASVEFGWIYTNYSPELIGETDTTVLFFYADWCPSCIAADNIISREDLLSSGITLLKTDFDIELDLKQKYWVTTQHTFVQLDAEGNLVSKWNWSNSLEDIQAKLK